MAKTGLARGIAGVAFVLCSGVAAGQSPEPENPPAASLTVTYVDGQLSIHGLNSTLADVLAKIAALTGAKLDVPPSVGSAPMPMVELGPGPVREVIASLLDDSSLDYLIQGSDADPAKIQSVMVMVREKKGAKAIEAADHPPRSPFRRGPALAAEPEDPPAAENPAPAQQEGTVADASSPSPAAAPPDQPASVPMGSTTQPVQLVQPGLSAGAMSPPADLSSQSINQQLQQMYQQRIQMVQQERQGAAPAVPANPGGK